jgi:thiol-disulfide isomerase/thioredoxin
MMRHRKHIWAAALVVATALAVPAFAATPDSADALFTQAKAQARQEHKHILMVFSASWCGPCKLYAKFLEDPEMKPITEKAFVVEHIDVGEMPGDTRHADTPGGVKLRSTLGAVSEPGFPFLVITNEDGNPIVNSYRNGDVKSNVGYPALPSEIDWYIEMLRQGAPGLSAADLAATRAWLTKHAPR